MSTKKYKKFTDDSELLARARLSDMKKKFFGNTQFNIDWNALNLN